MEGLPGFNCSGSGPIYPSVQRSPSSPPFSPLSSLSPPFSPHHESTEAAAGSRPSSPVGQVWTASPQASPPRHPYSPILFVRYTLTYSLCWLVFEKLTVVSIGCPTISHQN